MRMPIELENSLEKQDNGVSAYNAVINTDSFNPVLYIKTQAYIRSLINPISSCTCSDKQECESQNKFEISDIFRKCGEE